MAGLGLEAFSQFGCREHQLSFGVIFELEIVLRNAGNPVSPDKGVRDTDIKGIVAHRNLGVLNGCRTKLI